ncbi:MAG: hypothetical protein H7Z37_11245 [Pyrinomonadaceae bacterium]|nr:hypothetical protein [Pyrinomonadaceae bacterium]
MKILKIILLVCALLGGGLFVGTAIFNRQTHNRQTALDNEWRQTTGTTTAELLQKYPRQEKNESAVKLEELAARLLKVNGETNIKNVFESDFNRFAKRQSVESGEAKELSENLKTFLAAHQNDFESLYDFIEQNPAPHWKLNLEQPNSESFAAPQPLDFVFHRNLHRLIALDALDKTRQNKDDAALRAFAASWKAAESLRQRPELTAQIDNFIIAETQLQTLRQMKRVPPEWEIRILEPDYRRTGLEMLQLEYSAVHSSAFVPMSEWGRAENNTIWQQFLVARVLPVFEINQRLDFSAAGVRTVAYLQQTDFCSFDRKFSGFDDTTSGNGFFGHPIYINLIEKWQDYAELAFDSELTSQLLRAKRQATQLSGETAAEQSNLCKDSRWTIAETRDGSTVIEFSRAAELLKNTEIPLTYTIKARD